MVWLEFRKILKSPAFWLCSLIFLVSLLACSWEDIAVGDHGLMADGTYQIGALYELSNAFTYNGAAVAFPLLVVLPSSFLYLEEKGAYQQFCLLRADKKRYVRGKLAASLLSAVALTLLALLVYTVFMLWYFPAGFRDPSMNDFSMSQSFYYGLWKQGKFGWLYLVEVLRILCGAVMWPVFALAFSTLTDNKYVVIAAPFLTYMLFNFIGEMLEWHWIMPTWYEDIASFINNEPLGGWPLTFIYLAVWIGVPALVFAASFRRSFAHG